jgi:hypothetical protein
LLGWVDPAELEAEASGEDEGDDMSEEAEA